MADSWKKVLVGMLIGALIVGFVWHVRTERARHAPAGAMGPMAGGAPQARPGAPAGPAAGRGGPPGGSAFSQQPVGVVVAEARMERLSEQLEALGTARANESIEVTAKVSNLVSAVRFVEGETVRRGQVLVELDAEQARADLAIAEAALVESRSQYERSRELFATRVLSESQLDQLEATLKANEARVVASRSRLGDTVIRAPFDGRVGLRRISVGSLVNPGTVITTLDDTRTIKLDFTVPEIFLSDIEPGLAISARSVAYPDVAFDGRVASIDSRVDPTTRSVTVRALVPNPEGRLKPGMFLTVRIARGAKDAVVVPEHALVPEQGRAFVFVVQGDKAEKREVHIGVRRIGDVEIVSGLAAGERVVTEGTQKLRDGAPVRTVTPGAQPERAAAPQGAGR